MIKEFFIRLIQHLFALFIFDIPILNEFKRLVLSCFFTMGKKSYIAYDTILVSPHSRKQARMAIGNHVAIEHRCEIDYSGGITIKDNVWISEKVIITTHGHDIKKLKNNLF